MPMAQVPALVELTFSRETNSGQINLYYVGSGKCSEKEKSMERESDDIESSWFVDGFGVHYKITPDLNFYNINIT